MKWIVVFVTVSVILSCAKPDISKRSVEIITSGDRQDSIFQTLLKVIDSSSIAAHLNDSLAFLILPVQASCPSCRKKTIDSILKHKEDLADRHYIIISAGAGRDAINNFFKEQNGELPEIVNRLFLDTINSTYRLKLYDDKPTIYYVYDRKAYKKVAAVPITVRDDLREFFSGHRN